jgi:hypothetical protein
LLLTISTEQASTTHGAWFEMRMKVKRPSKRVMSMLLTASLIGLMICMTASGQIPVDDRSSTLYGTVTGTVTDADTGEALEGAIVTISYHGVLRDGTTDDEGMFTFANVPICFCMKTVSASMNGYGSLSIDVSVDEMTIVDLALVPVEDGEPDCGTVTGTVTDARTGEPIEGALVRVTHDGEVWKTMTDENGRYTLTGIPLCFCLKDISVSADGYEAQEESIAVGEETVKDFELENTEGNTDVIPRLPIRRVPAKMHEWPFIMASLAAASVGLVTMGYYAYMARV